MISVFLFKKFLCGFATAIQSPIPKIQNRNTIDPPFPNPRDLMFIVVCTTQ